MSGGRCSSVVSSGFISRERIDSGIGASERLLSLDLLFLLLTQYTFGGMGHKHEPFLADQLPGHGADAVCLVANAEQGRFQVADELLLAGDHPTHHLDLRMQAAVIEQVTTVLVVGVLTHLGELALHEVQLVKSLFQFFIDQYPEFLELSI